MRTASGAALRKQSARGNRRDTIKSGPLSGARPKTNVDYVREKGGRETIKGAGGLSEVYLSLMGD